MEFASPETRAQRLLEHVRETPMRRGALSKERRALKTRIAATLSCGGVPAVLAERMAFQLAFKCGLSDVRDETVWPAIAAALRQEIVRLRTRLGLANHQIEVVLPKLSAAQIEEFFDELTHADRRIARTVLDAAIDAADPIGTGRRYMAEYRLVAKQLHAIEPNIARTLANATFTAGMPLGKAMEHVQKFLTSIAKQKDHPDVARLLARAGFRAD